MTNGTVAPTKQLVCASAKRMYEISVGAEAIYMPPRRC